jgi:hypothetical protein
VPPSVRIEDDDEDDDEDEQRDNPQDPGPDSRRKALDTLQARPR